MTCKNNLIKYRIASEATAQLIKMMEDYRESMPKDISLINENFKVIWL